MPAKKDYPAIYHIDFPDMFSDNLFEKGRPLWHNKLLEFDGNETELAKYVKGLLMHNIGKFKPQVEVDRKYLSCGFFCIRVASYRPVRQYAGDFVAHSLATLIGIEVSRKDVLVLTAAYRSEPILSEVVARYTSTEMSMEEHLSNIVQSIGGESAIVEADVGDRGEIAICLGLLCTVDALRSAMIGDDYDPHSGKSMSCDIPVEDFLDELGVEPAIYTKYSGFIVNFSHFVRPAFVNKEQFIHAFERCAAVLLPLNSEGVDLAIVMFNEATEKYGSILIQVKNYLNIKFSSEGASKILDLCQLHQLFSSWGDNFDRNAIISILACAGGESFSANSESVAHLQEDVKYPRYITRARKNKKRFIWSRFTMTFHSMKKLSEDIQNKLWEISHKCRPEGKTGHATNGFHLSNRFGSFGSLEL